MLEHRRRFGDVAQGALEGFLACNQLNSSSIAAIDPTGYSSSQHGMKGIPAASAKGSASGTAIRTTSCPRPCSLRARVVVG
jgi:hypothetical protein